MQITIVLASIAISALLLSAQVQRLRRRRAIMRQELVPALVLSRRAGDRN